MTFCLDSLGHQLARLVTVIFDKKQTCPFVWDCTLVLFYIFSVQKMFVLFVSIPITLDRSHKTMTVFTVSTVSTFNKNKANI